MGTNYPGAVDSLTNPAAGDALNSPSHAAQHANANDAIEAVQTELGTNPSGGDATVAARLSAIEAGTNLGTNSVDAAAIQDGAVTPGKLAASGRFTFPTGAANGYGFTAGASHLSGTGSPESVVTAAPGSTFLQTDSTTDVKGWLRWIKATGTGNTGWVAGPEADTGWREVGYAAGEANWIGGNLFLRRVGNRVQVTAEGVKFTTANSEIYTLPAGFKSNYDMVISLLREGANNGSAYPIAISHDAVCDNFWNSISGGTHSSTNSYSGLWTFITPDGWPSSLPGTAA